MLKVPPFQTYVVLSMNFFFLCLQPLPPPRPPFNAAEGLEGIGWSDLTLFAIFWKWHISDDQIFLGAQFQKIGNFGHYKNLVQHGKCQKIFLKSLPPTGGVHRQSVGFATNTKPRLVLTGWKLPITLKWFPMVREVQYCKTIWSKNYLYTLQYYLGPA